jgi:hypothetical protein
VAGCKVSDGFDYILSSYSVLRFANACDDYEDEPDHDDFSFVFGTFVGVGQRENP